MKYILIAVCLLLTVAYSVQGVVQSSTQTPDVTGKQNSTNSSEPTPAARSIDNNSSHKNSALNDVIPKTNITSNGTKAGSGDGKQTEAPVIINGSTIPLPGTQISDVTTTPPTPTSTSSEKPTVTTSTPTKPTSVSTPSTPNTVPTTAPTHRSSTVSTIKPASTAEPITPSPTHHRGFDGPSFVGGIVLALGLVAIGFVAFKFYKARTELNYHTL